MAGGVSRMSVLTSMVVQSLWRRLCDARRIRSLGRLAEGRHDVDRGSPRLTCAQRMEGASFLVPGLIAFVIARVTAARFDRETVSNQ
jgi:hypothetical protein